MASSIETAEADLFAPLGRQIDSLQQAANLRQVLDATRPDLLQAAVEQGLRQVELAAAGRMSPDTRSGLQRMRERSAALVKRLDPHWKALDSHDRYGLVKGALRGAFGPESAVGATIGGFIFPGVGHVVGGMVGGLFAGHRIDEEAKRHAAQLDACVSQLSQGFVADYESHVRPYLTADLAPTVGQEAGGWGCALLAVGAVTLAGAVVGLAYWFW